MSLPVSVDLSVVIVNYNTGQLTLDCVTSIFQNLGNLKVEVIVVDNASTDNSVAAIQSRWPEVMLIANSVNRYFSAANNQGINAAQGQYVLVLNPDTVIRGQTLSQLIDYMRAHPAVGAATTTMYFPDDTLQHNGSRNVTLSYLIYQYTVIGKLFRRHARKLNETLWYPLWDRTTERQVGVLPGSAIIAERMLWQSIGGFHPAMLMYFSDDYFSAQIRQHGKQTVFVPSDGITHYENASTRKVSRHALTLYFRDLLAYTRLVFGFPAQAMLSVLLVPTWVVQYLKAH